ncbi:hypothetical protein BD289DRAFT_49204 [Coniella lustricola]|uniref:Uncharacterized protein n=1 Tax=Coniella lustricola TaxID=2025994 RepID=A0A2T3AIK4_9PEZI|nr:hypothetical protein BD289DRAFT_49204 [Coniella lustricola]
MQLFHRPQLPFVPGEKRRHRGNKAPSFLGSQPIMRSVLVCLLCLLALVSDVPIRAKCSEKDSCGWWWAGFTCVVVAWASLAVLFRIDDSDTVCLHIWVSTYLGMQLVTFWCPCHRHRHGCSTPSAEPPQSYHHNRSGNRDQKCIFHPSSFASRVFSHDADPSTVFDTR